MKSNHYGAVVIIMVLQYPAMRCININGGVYPRVLTLIYQCKLIDCFIT